MRLPPRTCSALTRSSAIVAMLSSSSPLGERPGAAARRPRPSLVHAHRPTGWLEKTQPSRSQHVGERRRGRLVQGHRSTGRRARRRTCRRGSGGRAHARASATRPSGPPSDLRELHRGDHEREASARARRRERLPAPSSDARAARSASDRQQVRIRVQRHHLVAAARPGRAATRPVPRPEVEDRAAAPRPPARARAGGRRRRSRTPRRARPRPRSVTRTTASPGRGRRAGRAARAAPCRWAARRRARRAAFATGAVERVAEVALHARAPRRSPAYFSRSAISSARVPLQVTRRTRPGQHLEVGVPDPGDVAAVGDPVVQRHPEVELAVLERQRAQHLVRAGRVLDQQDRDVGGRHRDRLDAAERAAEALERLADGRERHAQLQRGRGGRDGVVDVVEARAAGGAPTSCPCGRAQRRPRDPSMPSSATRVAATCGSGRARPQFGQR